MKKIFTKTKITTKNAKITDRKLEDKDICYVVIKNTTLIRWVKNQQQKDEVTQVLKVFRSEQAAQDFVSTLKTRMNESTYVIPTLYEEK